MKYSKKETKHKKGKRNNNVVKQCKAIKLLETYKGISSLLKNNLACTNDCIFDGCIYFIKKRFFIFNAV